MSGVRMIGNRTGKLKRVAFVGGAFVGLGFLKALVRAHGDGSIQLVGAIAGHKGEKQAPLIEPYATAKGFPVFKKPEELPDPDIIVSAGNHIIFSKAILARCRVINFHAAPLPSYAGSGAMAWAILNDEKQFGVTFHDATEALDAGAYFWFEPFPIDPAWTAGELDAMCGKTGIDAFAKNLTAFFTGSLPAIEIPKGDKPPYKRADLEQYREVDLSWPRDKVLRHVRAFDWDGILQPAFFRLGDQTIYLTMRVRGRWI